RQPRSRAAIPPLLLLHPKFRRGVGVAMERGRGPVLGCSSTLPPAGMKTGPTRRARLPLGAYARPCALVAGGTRGGSLDAARGISNPCPLVLLPRHLSPRSKF